MIELRILKKTADLNLDSILFKVFNKKSVQKFIESLNREQLAESVDARGIQLSYIDRNGNERTSYSPLTEKLSGGKKKVGQPFNLKDTGEFYKSIKAFPELKGIEITADADKEDDNLFQKFGKDIVGLTYENLQKLIEFIKPLFIEVVRKELLS